MERNRNLFVVVVLIIATVSLSVAQQNRYWIQFSDKNGTAYSLQDPSKFLSKASIERRVKYGIALTTSDLPVTQSYIDQVRAVPHTRVHYALKWLNGVLVSFDAATEDSAALEDIKALPFVESGNRVRRVKKMEPVPQNPEGQRVSAVSSVSSFDYGGSASQITQLKLDCLHEKNYRGQGMVIAVLDAGFTSVPSTIVFDSLRADKRLLGTVDFVDGGSAYKGGDHGTQVLSCMAAMSPGVAMGTAPLASYWLIRTEEGARETISEEYNWIRGAEFADSVGADLLTTSLGYTTFDITEQNHDHSQLNGRTAPMSIGATMAARKGMFVLNAAGNDGDKLWRKIGVPADADSICTVGAVGSSGLRAPFSSMGPTADNRIKPDLMAMGSQAWVCGGNVCWPGDGTSYATPVLAGAVACYWQANRSLNNIRILQKLRSLGSQAGAPDTLSGWGIPALCDSNYAYYSPPRVHFPPVPQPYTFSAISTTNGFDLQLPPAEYDEISVTVHDVLGKVIYQGTADGVVSQVSVPLAGLQAGIYIVSVHTAAGSANKKILRLDL